MPRRYHFGRVRPGRRWVPKLDPRWLSFILAGVFLTVVISSLNRRIAPILTAMAVTNANNAVTETVNRAILDGIASEHISYGDMVTISTGTNGQITALTSDLEQANLLRAELLALVLEAVSALSEEDFSIPVGNLTDISLFSGRGPSVHMQVLSTGAASAAFEHEFTDAGINQTLHQIMLNINVTVQILLPGNTLELSVPTQVCVAETIIVGEVPGTYFEMER